MSDDFNPDGWEGAEEEEEWNDPPMVEEDTNERGAIRSFISAVITLSILTSPVWTFLLFNFQVAIVIGIMVIIFLLFGMY